MKDLVPLFMAALVALAQFIGWNLDAAAIEAFLTAKVTSGAAFAGAAYALGHAAIKLYDKWTAPKEKP